jgi:hypothetical protein
VDIYEKFFVKMHKKGFPSEFEGFGVRYDFKNYQAELVIFPTIKKILKMWELLSE